MSGNLQEIQSILETALYADDLDAAEDFYGGILALEKVSRAGNRHVFFRCGPGMVLIFNPNETIKPAGSTTMPVPSHGASGAGHACFAVSADRLPSIKQKMHDNGIEIEADFCWPNGARSLYVRDPAGNSIEFGEPRMWGFTDNQI